jgi:4-hydroxy-tetrahydrodipicolinate synthase
MDAALTGVMPVVPTIFRDDESVDLEGTARVVDYLLDGAVDGLCLLANYSEQFSLTDAERDTIARTLLEHIAGRVPVIVTTSHYSARVAAGRSRAAQDMGAAMVMLMPPFFGATLTVPGPAVIEYFRQVTDAIDIPVMVQDAALAPLVTLYLKGKSFSVVTIPSENITLAGTAYKISVSQVNVASIQGPNGRLLLVTFQPTFGRGRGAADHCCRAQPVPTIPGRKLTNPPKEPARHAALHRRPP